MAKTASPKLLPGVAPAGMPPQVVCETVHTIRRARIRAAVRDAADLLLLLVVDAFFVGWPRAHVPLLDRHDSITVLIVVNVVVMGYVWLSRRIPQWRARRIAATWSTRERTKLDR